MLLITWGSQTATLPLKFESKLNSLGWFCALYNTHSNWKFRAQLAVRNLSIDSRGIERSPKCGHRHDILQMKEHPFLCVCVCAHCRCTHAISLPSNLYQDIPFHPIAGCRVTFNWANVHRNIKHTASDQHCIYKTTSLNRVSLHYNFQLNSIFTSNVGSNPRDYVDDVKWGYIQFVLKINDIEPTERNTGEVTVAVARFSHHRRLWHTKKGGRRRSGGAKVVLLGPA